MAEQAWGSGGRQLARLSPPPPHGALLPSLLCLLDSGWEHVLFEQQVGEGFEFGLGRCTTLVSVAMPCLCPLLSRPIACLC